MFRKHGNIYRWSSTRISVSFRLVKLNDDPDIRQHCCYDCLMRFLPDFSSSSSSASSLSSSSEMLATRTMAGGAGLAVGDDGDEANATSALPIEGLVCSMVPLIFEPSSSDLFGFGNCHSSSVTNMGSAPCFSQYATSCGDPHELRITCSAAQTADRSQNEAPKKTMKDCGGHSTQNFDAFWL